ncbi:helix-turn-helix transcriptional regulator [Amycolatopsis thermophila]|uniref:Excisionase family DNA binding protein n=1 Tax=Amycolatopsis thermophila TaxID=206084 RepID=A0ABU0EY90_9PSEU|nr:helix-turn-helix domain-containing protein [Amycolatopsis thermophila]MDQ0380279.1 excisionase family DNA binding protein [Amycolatopsis thermophila]
MTRKLLSIEDLADYLGVPKGTLYQWRTKGYGPQGRRIGKYVRYRPEDVDAWVEQQGVA